MKVFRGAENKTLKFLEFRFSSIKIFTKNTNFKFHKVLQCRRTTQVRWKTFRILCGKYIQDNKYKILVEWAWFCRRCDKNIWCVFGLQFQLLFTYKTRTPRFTRQCSDIIQVSWKKYKLQYRKFVQDSVYQIVSKSTEFYRRIKYKKPGVL